MPELMLSIPLAKLKPSPLNTRKHLGDPAKLSELAASMKEHGVLEPVIARQSKRGESYEMVCGHRRLAAAKEAGLASVPAIVRELTDDQVVDVMLIENGQREDVAPLDEAEAFQAAMKRGRTVADIAEKIGRPPSFVAQRLQLLKLSKELRKELDEGKLSLAAALLIARIPDPKQQVNVLEDIRNDSYDGPMTVEQIRKLIEEHYMLRLQEAPFDTTDAKLVPKAGACTTCPKRTGHQRELFADVKNGDLCTDEACFGAKKEVMLQLKLKVAKDGGQTVLEGKDATKALAYDGGYVGLDTDHWLAGKRKTVRQLVAKAKPPVVLAKSGTGEVRELIKKSDFLKCLPKKEQSFQRSNDASGREIDRAAKQREAKERRRKKAAKLALAAAVENAGKISAADLLELVTRAFAARAWNEVQKAILERRGVNTKGYGLESRLLKLINESKSKAELHGFALELALGTGQLGYSTSGKVWEEGLKLAGVKLETYQRQIAVEEAAKAKKKPAPKKKAAAKKATAKKTTKKRKAKS